MAKKNPETSLPRKTSIPLHDILYIALGRPPEEAKRYDAAKFKETIVKRIENTSYRPLDSKADGPLFVDILKKAGVLDTFLSDSVLNEAEDWVLFRDSLREQVKLRATRRSSQSFPLQFHKSLLTELAKHYERVEDISQRYCGSLEPVQFYLVAVAQEIVHQSEFWRRSFHEPEFLKKITGNDQLESPPRNLEINLKIALFRVLQSHLQTPHSKKLGISDQFLHALTLLIWGSPDDAADPSGEALKQAIRARGNPVVNPKKSNKKTL